MVNQLGAQTDGLLAAYWATLPEPEIKTVFTLESIVLIFQHFLNKINQTITGGFGTDQATSPIENPYR